MRKKRNVLSVLGLSAATVTLAATGAGATAHAETGTRVQATCHVSGAFCATSDSGGSLVLYCGMSRGIPWSGGGTWNNRLPGNGVVRMFDANGDRIYTTPANYGPVRGNWTPVYSIRADC
ncbi:hypothetical protein [Streptomyces sp. NPDC014995]|uniref:hypothetical protein n=1 Tax=Streptomyces sp. NPDC014995 TaxID=3364936 RepID=UPI0036FDC815